MKTQENSAERLLEIIEKQDQQIAELTQQNQWLMEQFRLLKHTQYGISSEQSTCDQINIFNEAEAFADPSLPEPEISQVKSHYRKKTRLLTDKLPEDIPVEIITHELPEEECHCPECGEKLHTMGKEVREELKIIPAQAVIVRHVR